MTYCHSHILIGGKPIVWPFCSHFGSRTANSLLPQLRLRQVRASLLEHIPSAIIFGCLVQSCQEQEPSSPASYRRQGRLVGQGKSRHCSEDAGATQGETLVGQGVPSESRFQTTQSNRLVHHSLVQKRRVTTANASTCQNQARQERQSQSCRRLQWGYGASEPTSKPISFRHKRTSSSSSKTTTPKRPRRGGSKALSRVQTKQSDRFCWALQKASSRSLDSSRAGSEPSFCGGRYLRQLDHDGVCDDNDKSKKKGSIRSYSVQARFRPHLAIVGSRASRKEQQLESAELRRNGTGKSQSIV